MFSLYVTGTDTGIGKTLASSTLLHALRGHGLRVAGMKPVASGCERIDGEWRNEDALALQRASEAGIDDAVERLAVVRVDVVVHRLDAGRAADRPVLTSQVRHQDALAAI